MVCSSGSGGRGKTARPPIFCVVNASYAKDYDGIIKRSGAPEGSCIQMQIKASSFSAKSNNRISNFKEVN